MPEPEAPVESLPELIVIGEPGADLTGATADPGVDTGAVATILADVGAALASLFEPPLAEEVEAAATSTGRELPDLSMYFDVSAPVERMEETADRLLALDGVAGAYVKPPAVPAGGTVATPDFTAQQGYLGAAPDGVDAASAWALAGGDGTGVRIVDVEQGWQLTHEDLAQNNAGLIAGTMATSRDHGTAVLGVLGGDTGSFGVTGICPGAVTSVSSHLGIKTSQAIRAAAKTLGPGDLLLIEVHRAGPAFGFTVQPQNRGFIALEWWEDDFDAIDFATAQGIIVVEAAGNGYEDLDAAIYDTPAKGFSKKWINPFRRQRADCGAILVGAGAPPPGTHGNDWGADRSRLDFSNWGLAVDAQGWGREVTTAGYGSLFGKAEGLAEDQWYTNTFNGTSSASPIVTGALACAQGAVKAAGQAPLVPWRARQLVRAFGSPQQDGPNGPRTQRIGRRPDLAQLVPQAVSPPARAITKLADMTWTPGWSSLGTFMMNGRAHLFGVKASDGSVFADSVDDGGATTTNVLGTAWSAGWTNVVGVELGGVPHLCSYKAGAGDASIDCLILNDQGTIDTTTTYSSTWSTDWRAMTTVPVGGVPHLVCYGAGGGGWAVDPFLADGSGFDPTLATGGNWASDWTHVVGHDLGGEPYLFEYKGGLGGVALDRVEGGGGDVTIRFRDQWRPNWTAFSPLVLDGLPFQASYNGSDGTLSLDRLIEDGDGFDTTTAVDIGAGWTHLVAFAGPGGPQLLTYDEVGGAAAFWAIA